MDPTAGQVWRYIFFEGPKRGQEDPASDIKLTRPGVLDGDWLGVLVKSDEEWRANMEWRVTREQFEEGRYRLVVQVAPTGVEIPVPTRSEFIGNLKRVARD